MRKRALITGCTGFTGIYLKEKLKKNFEVFGTTLEKSKTNDNTFLADIADKEKLKKVLDIVKPDIVANLAAISHVEHESLSELYLSNIVGVRNLLYLLSESSYKPESILLVSSANIYGNTKDDPITENTIPNLNNDYSISKFAMEKVGEIWLKSLPIFFVRPFNYTGVKQSKRFLIPKIVDHFKNHKKKIELGNLDIYRDYSDVRDVTDQYAKLLIDPPIGKILNICSGKATSIRQIINILNKIANYEIEVIQNPEYIRDNDIKYLRGGSIVKDKKIKFINKFDIEDTLLWMYRNE